MKRLNYMSLVAKIFGCGIVGLTPIVSACKSRGNVAGQIEISGKIIDSEDGSPLKDAIAGATLFSIVS